MLGSESHVQFGITSKNKTCVSTSEMEQLVNPRQKEKASTPSGQVELAFGAQPTAGLAASLPGAGPKIDRVSVGVKQI